MPLPSERSTVPGFWVPLLHEEIFGGKASRALLDDQLRRIDWRGVAEVAAGIAAASWADSMEEQKHQVPLVRNFATNPMVDVALIRRVIAEPHRPIFTRESVLAVLCEAVILRNEIEASQLEFNDAFLRAVLIANELLSGEITPETATGTAQDLLRSELRSQVLNIDGFHDLIARTDAFFSWATTATAQESENALTIEADFERFTGLSWRSYAAAAYACLSRGVVPPGGREPSVLFALDEWLSPVVDQSPIRRWFDVSSIGVDEAAAIWGSPIRCRSLHPASCGVGRSCEHRMEASSFRPRLVQNAMGDGVFFALLDGYIADDATGALRKRFTRFFGEYFENYVAERLENAYARRADANVRRQTSYKKGKQRILSTDVIVAENGDVFFFEVMAKRPNFLESVVALDNEAIEADADAFVRKARELDKRIADWRTGLYYEDMTRASGQRVFPIIVTPTSWPRVHLLHSVLPKTLADEKLLAGCEPIELMDAGDLELLEGGLQLGVRLGALLDRKNGDGRRTDSRFKSLSDYLIFYEPSLFDGNPRPSRERGAAVAREIIALAETWFVPLSAS